MQFGILGRVEVLADGRRVALSGDKQRALLALLLIHANRTLSAERLIDELWGEHPPANAAKTFQMHISRLRRALDAPEGDDGFIATRERGYELTVDRDRVDSLRFERLIDEARSELVAGRIGRASALLEEGLSLWRGPPLAEFVYEPFAQQEIARLEELRIGALEELVEAKLELGRHTEVVGELDALIAAYPYRERLWGQMMLALYRSERQAEALQAYQNARRKLVGELGIEPGERLRELERAILAQDPRLAFIEQQGSVTEQAAEVSRGTFVGRKPELSELVDGLDDATRGRGRLTLVTGEPGIGKSRLAEELIAQGEARGARVLVGRCWEAGGAPAYWPWVQMMRSYVRGSDTAALRSELGPGAADLAQMIPELHQRFPDIGDPPKLAFEPARFRLFDAVGEFLRNASRSRPLVLVLDDLHAADAASLLLLRFLARELGSMPVLIVGLYRDVDPAPDEPLSEMITELAREPVSRRITLAGLSELEVEQYVQLTAAHIGASELVATLYARTEGNPLFVSEIVRLLSTEARLSGDAVLTIPQSVRDVIGRRLAHLSPECQGLLALASVIGGEFALRVVAGAAGASEDELLELLDEATEARVVCQVPGDSSRFRFAHVLIRDTLYEDLGAARRIRLHRQVQHALEAFDGDQSASHLAALAHHAIAARDFDKACLYARRAGDRELALFAYEEAARLYQSALDALDRADPSASSERCQLLLSLGEARARAGNTLAAQAVSLEAAEIARRAGFQRALAHAAACYGGRVAWGRAGSDRRLVPLLEEGLAALAGDDVELRARLLARLAGALRDEPKRDRRDALSREAVELARRAGSDAALAYALDGRAMAIYGPDNVKECLAASTELCEVAERIGDTERLVHGYWGRFFAQIKIGNMRRAEIDLAAAYRVARELRQPAQLWEVLAAQTMLALATGSLGEAEDLIPKAFAFGEHSQPDLAITSFRVQRYTLCDFRGTLPELEPLVEDLVERYRSRPVFRCLVAHIRARTGQQAEAKRALDELAPDNFSAIPFDQEWLYGMSLLAETAALVSDTESAPALYELMLPWAEFNVADLPEGVRGSTWRYLGQLAATLGRWPEAGAHFENALVANQRMGLRPWLALTQHDYARALLMGRDSGNREHALGLIAAAIALYQELGMDSAAVEAAELQRALQLASAVR